MTTINIGNIDNPYFIEFDKVQDAISNNSYYIVKWSNEHEFIMVKNSYNDMLTIKGVAPYAAREAEDNIIAAITAYDKVAA